MATKDIVLVAQYYIDNGWYGDRYRVILSKEEGLGFTTKTEAKKYAAKLKKRGLNVKGAKKPVILCDERTQFEEYTYISCGPSLSYTHINITVNDLN